MMAGKTVFMVISKHYWHISSNSAWLIALLSRPRSPTGIAQAGITGFLLLMGWAEVPRPNDTHH
jgi:hypothetical protein